MAKRLMAKRRYGLKCEVAQFEDAPDAWYDTKVRLLLEQLRYAGVIQMTEGGDEFVIPLAEYVSPDRIQARMKSFGFTTEVVEL